MFDPGPITRFAARARTAAQANAREVRLDTGEALALSATLAELLALLRVREKPAGSTSVGSALDGGGFKD